MDGKIWKDIESIQKGYWLARKLGQSQLFQGSEMSSPQSGKSQMYHTKDLLYFSYLEPLIEMGCVGLN